MQRVLFFYCYTPSSYVNFIIYKMNGCKKSSQLDRIKKSSYITFLYGNADTLSKESSSPFVSRRNAQMNKKSFLFWMSFVWHIISNIELIIYNSELVYILGIYSKVQ